MSDRLCFNCNSELGAKFYAGCPLTHGRADLCLKCHRIAFGKEPGKGTLNDSGTVADQPPPVPNDRPAVWDLVIADMKERDLVGRQRYGTPLQPHNGRDALVDAYQEALDLVVYLRQKIEEERGAATS